MMFRFAYPAVLLLLIPAIGHLFLMLRRKPSTVTHSLASNIAKLAGEKGRKWSLLVPLLRTLCLILLALTAARPQLYNVSREIRSPGVDILLCLDTSGSMRALDFTLDGEPVSRLVAVKKVVSDFIQKRDMDRIGLIVFGENAFTQAPLTLDKGLLLELVDHMKIGMAGDSTSIGTAIAIGSKRLKDLKAKSKILILLTDGRHNAGDITPVEAAEAAHALGIKIYTIGVGGKGPVPFKIRTVFGERVVHQQVDLDEKVLKKIAQLGKGKYFRAADTEALAEIYDIIDKEEKTESKVKEFFHFEELYLYALIPAVFLLGMELFLKNSWLRIVP